MTIFEGLKLISYPGENVGDLFKDCMKYLRMMEGSYSLLYNVQFTFLYKINDTNSQNFNYQVQGHMQKVLEMEDLVGQHKSPLEIKKHSYYSFYNIWKLCEMVSSIYRQEVGHNCWIVEHIPNAEGNLADVSSTHFCWDGRS